MTQLTKDQEKACNDFFSFLFSNDRFFCINGAGGTGKSFLINHIITEVVPAFQEAAPIIGIDKKIEDVFVTATTNKACDSLSKYLKYPIETIHALLGLFMSYSKSTGKAFLNCNKSVPASRAKQPNQLIIIDECSLIDSELWGYLNTLIHPTSKILLVGDMYQLPPVSETVSPLYKHNIPTVTLNNTVRTNKDELKEMWESVRKSVKGGPVPTIKLCAGSIEHIPFNAMQSILANEFNKPTHYPNHSILSFTNAAAIDFSSYISKDVRGEQSRYSVGTYMVNNAYLDTAFSNTRLYVDEVIRIDKVGLYKHFSVSTNAGYQCIFAYQLFITRVSSNTKASIWAIADKAKFDSILKTLAKEHRWESYYTMKENLADLRMLECSTIHKSQGSTVDTVYINCDDLNKCRDFTLSKRLLYVAITRARNKVVFFGELNPKLGRIVNEAS